MALSEQRYEEIDSTLQEMHQYLLAIATELDTTVPNPDQQEYIYQVATQLLHLRQWLSDTQKPQK